MQGPSFEPKTKKKHESMCKTKINAWAKYSYCS